VQQLQNKKTNSYNAWLNARDQILNLGPTEAYKQRLFVEIIDGKLDCLNKSQQAISQLYVVAR
jgi:hypothetical protein